MAYNWSICIIEKIGILVGALILLTASAVVNVLRWLSVDVVFLEATVSLLAFVHFTLEDVAFREALEVFHREDALRVNRLSLTAQ